MDAAHALDLRGGDADRLLHVPPLLRDFWGEFRGWTIGRPSPLPKQELATVRAEQAHALDASHETELADHEGGADDDDEEEDDLEDDEEDLDGEDEEDEDEEDGGDWDE